MRRLIWSERALADLTNIRVYVSQFAPLAAQRLTIRLIGAAERLPSQPGLGRPVGRDIRELVTVAPYIIRYQIYDGAVEIIRIKHGARRPD